MSIWWVNHKQTLEQEISNGYIWAPKTKVNGNKNEFYENMKKAMPGDYIFSYANSTIVAVGVVYSPYIEKSKPNEFGNTGNWNNEGYLVTVDWFRLTNEIKPRNYWDRIKDDFPKTYSPLNKEGNGNQGCYLAEISQSLFEKLIAIICKTNELDYLFEKNRTIIENVISNDFIEIERKTEREALVLSRIGQGKYKENVISIEKKCRITGVNRPSLLIASHIKPWKDCTNIERLDGNNGLLLSPHIDKLFDRYLISFNKNGQLLYNENILEILKKWNIMVDKSYGEFSVEQEKYLSLHREKFVEKISKGYIQ